jgi:hypothetical protein
VTFLMLVIHRHLCRITPINHHQRRKVSLQSKNSYRHSAPVSLGPQSITETQAAARRLLVLGRIPGVRWTL